MKMKILQPLWLIILPMVIFACTCSVKSEQQPEVTDKNKGRGSVADSSGTLVGYFSIVNCKASDFANLASNPGNGKRRNALFVKYQNGSSGLNLAGWQFKRIQQNPPQFGFSETPDLSFSVGAKSTLAYAPGVTLGDLILSNQEVHTIKAAIAANSSYPYLVFTPVSYGSGSAFVGYTLSLSNSPTGLIRDFSGDGNQVAFKNIPLNVRSNPIPPGGGNILEIQ